MRSRPEQHFYHNALSPSLSAANIERAVNAFTKIFGKGFAGDGFHGDAVLSTYISAANDMAWNSLTINATKGIHMAGYRAFSRTYIDNNGHIEADGNDGIQSGGEGDPGAGGAAITGSMGTGAAGISGVSGPADGQNEIAGLASNHLGGVGGNGGGTTNHLGGVSDIKLDLGANQGFMRSWFPMFGFTYGNLNIRMHGGIGGASGGSEAGDASGGGGGGGAPVAVITPWLLGSGAIHSDGGNGNIGENLDLVGGSGGGGGGILMLCYWLGTGTWYTSVAGGFGGFAVSSASPGQDGGAGQVFIVKHL